jgi:dienelactone hydrolase
MTPPAVTTETPPTVTTRRPSTKRALRLTLAAAAVLALLLVRPATHHARAASLLMSFSDPASDHGGVAEERVTFRSGGGDVPARLYAPKGVAHPPGVVLVHGVHRGGIDEPRLERFARAVAGTGVVVMTPAMKELSGYEVAPRSIDTVGDALESLRARLGEARVGLMGMSFGGGISLLAAADPRFADHVSFVVAVGAHDDLGRVSRFFVTSEAPAPGGGVKRLHAHRYGAMVLVYSHAEDLFPPEDVPGARDALRLWLGEQREDARSAAARLSPPSRAKIEGLFESGASAMQAELLEEIEARGAEMARVSPHGQLGSIHANVYLLHGEGDTVIPATETLWLAEEVPPERLKRVLVSPAIEHVELKSPTAADKWALVHFMGQVLGEGS